jgi:hypothetical protein
MPVRIEEGVYFAAAVGKGGHRFQDTIGSCRRPAINQQHAISASLGHNRRFARNPNYIKVFGELFVSHRIGRVRQTQSRSPNNDSCSSNRGPE